MKCRITRENPKQVLAPGIRPISLKGKLEAEARKPLRGGAAPMAYNSLFGEKHLEGDLFAVAYPYRKA